MQKRARWQFETGMLTVEFVRTYPNEKVTALLAGNDLEGKLREAADVSLEQQQGLRQVRSSTARKRELRSLLIETQLDHISKVGLLAARELPNLKETFAFSHKRAPYVLFRTTAEALSIAGEKYKDVLLKYGLSATALDDLRQKLAEFDAASEAGMQGRLQHIGASSRLQKLAAEITRIVNGMDGVVRFQFQDQPDALDAWRRASSVITVSAPHETEPPAPPVDGVENAA